MTTTAERASTTTPTAIKRAVLGHIAVACAEPDETTQFYREVFGLVHKRSVKESYARGHVLTDGFIELGFYKFSDDYLKAHDDVPGRRFRPGFTGFHHAGFYHPDAKALTATLEAQGRAHGNRAEHDAAVELNPNWVGTDQMLFTLSDHDWTPRATISKDVARVRHIGVACLDPYSSKRFFGETLGMQTTEKYAIYGGFADGFGASDGNISYALLRFNEPYQHAHDDERGFEVGFAGLHHVGFFVNDLEWTHAQLREHKCLENMQIRKFLEDHNKNQYVVEEKYIGPDRTSFEVSGVDWKVRKD